MMNSLKIRCTIDGGSIGCFIYVYWKDTFIVKNWIQAKLNLLSHAVELFDQAGIIIMGFDQQTAIVIFKHNKFIISKLKTVSASIDRQIIIIITGSRVKFYELLKHPSLNG